MSSSDGLFEKKGAGAFVLGLTGGIGTGKSTAAEYLISKGFEHIDADGIGRDLTAKGSPVLHVLEETFGPAAGGTILFPDGSLDRKKLASIVFGDPDQKRKLDEIMFAEIGSIISGRIEEARRAGGDDGSHRNLLLDAPLLFESGLDRLCDSVLLITCDLETRIRRVSERDGSTREEVLARINSQMSDEEKAALADHQIDNSGTMEDLFRRLDGVVDRSEC